MPAPLRLVALASGGGTTLQNLLDRAAAGTLAGRVVGVVASKPTAFAVERAKAAGVPCEIVRRDDRFAENVWAAVRVFRPDLVCLAGWLHLLPIPPDFRHRVLNIHPSLLPAFGGQGMYGRHVHEAVLVYGTKVTGCTVHFADDSYDTGPILVQRCVPVLDADDADTLAARVFAAECEAFPEAINLIAAGRVRVEGRRAVVSGPPRAEPVPVWEVASLCRLSVEKQHAIVAAGIMDENDRCELLDGILVGRPAKGPRHDSAVTALNRLLIFLIPDGWSVLRPAAITCTTSEPEPDFALVRGTIPDYRERFPGASDTCTVIEIASASLQLDRHVKLHIYAASGIPTYWIVNVVDNVVEVYTDPTGSGDTATYATTAEYRPGDAVPVVLDGRAVGTIPVAKIMGPTGEPPASPAVG